MIRLLEPWFLVPGVLAAAIVTALHFVVRSPVRRAPLPTVRFLSPAPHTAVRLRRRPHDLLLLALRVLFALSLAAAFARPVWTANVVARAGILLLDRGAGMAGAWNAALDSVSARLGSDRLTVIVFDTVAIAATPRQVDIVWINEMRDGGTSGTESDYRIAFHALAREAGSIAADAYEAALVTVPRWSAWREGTTSVRAAAWPGMLDVIVPPSTAPAAELPPPTRVFAQQGSALFDAVEALGMTAVTDTATAIHIVGPDSVANSAAYGWQFVPDTSTADDVMVFSGGWSVAAPRRGAFTRSGAIGAVEPSSGGAAAGAVEPPARTGGAAAGAVEAPARMDGAVAGGVAIAAWRDGSLAAMAIGESPCTIATAFDPDDDALTMSHDYPELIRHLVSGCADERASLAAVPLDSGAMRTLRGSGDAYVQAADLPVPPAGRPLGTPLLLLALFCAVAEWGVRRRNWPSHSPVGTGV